VQCCQHPHQIAPQGTALLARGLLHHGPREDPPLDRLHDVELGADHAGVFAQCVHARHRHRGVLQGLHRPVFAIHLMGRGQQLPGRLLAQHIAPGGALQHEGRIALPALELAHPQRPGETFDMLRQKAGQRHLVEFVALPDRCQFRHFCFPQNCQPKESAKLTG
jgi:hypothetical protein